MLIGGAPKKVNLHVVRRIKQALHEALELPQDAIITVTQLACLEKDCAPLETVIGLLRPDSPQLQHKVHNETEAITTHDLVEVCNAWGFSVQYATLDAILKEL